MYVGIFRDWSLHLPVLADCAPIGGSPLVGLLKGCMLAPIGGRVPGPPGRGKDGSGPPGLGLRDPTGDTPTLS